MLHLALPVRSRQSSCSPSDPAAQWTGAMRGPAFFAYPDNYLIDVSFGIIIDVGSLARHPPEPEVGAAPTMIDRTEKCFGLKPNRLAADTAYGSAPMLNWLVEERQIAPHIPVVDKSQREDRRLLAVRLQVEEARWRLHLPERQSAQNKWHDSRRQDVALSSLQTRLRCLFAQDALLPQGAISKDPPRHS